jgi:hypothetical protein
MLLNPENDKQFRNPDSEDSQTVKAGVTAGADRDQPIGMIDARFPVMHMELFGGSAGPALTTIAFQYSVPKTTEAIA